MFDFMDSDNGLLSLCVLEEFTAISQIFTEMLKSLQK